MATLRLDVDSSGAARGVSRFEQVTGRASRSASQADRAVGGLERSFIGLRGAVIAAGAVVTALGLAQLASGFIGVGRSAVQTAGEFEQYELRLTTLIGSNERAAESLDNLKRIASETPFALQEIVAGATTLGSVFLGRADDLEEFTQAAANLAAITGLSFQQAAEGIQRSLSAGIAAADTFRERGVTQIIEGVTGMRNLVEADSDRVREALLSAFGADGVFGNAAENLSNTIVGALSNIGDAADNFRDSLGRALAPSVIATARGLFIPFFETLEQVVKQNDVAIRDFAVNGILSFVRGMEVTIRVGADVVRVLGFVGLNLENLVAVTRVVGAAFSVLWDTTILGGRFLERFFLQLGERIASVLNLAGVVSDQSLANLRGQIAGATADINAKFEDAEQSALDFAQALGDATATVTLNTGAADRINSFADGIRDAANRVEEIAESVSGGVTPSVVELNTEVAKTGDLIAGSTLSVDELDAAVKAMIPTWKEQEQAVKDAADAQREVERTATRFSGIVSSGLSEAIRQTRSWEDALLGIVDRFADIAIQSAANAAFQPLIAGGLGFLGGFATGGDFIVPGSGPPDSRLMAVSPGERVTVRTPEQQRMSTGGAGFGGRMRIVVENLPGQNAVAEEGTDEAGDAFVTMRIVEDSNASLETGPGRKTQRRHAALPIGQTV